MATGTTHNDKTPHLGFFRELLEVGWDKQKERVRCVGERSVHNPFLRKKEATVPSRNVVKSELAKSAAQRNKDSINKLSFQETRSFGQSNQSPTFRSHLKTGGAWTGKLLVPAHVQSHHTTRIDTREVVWHKDLWSLPKKPDVPCHRGIIFLTLASGSCSCPEKKGTGTLCTGAGGTLQWLFQIITKKKNYNNFWLKPHR